MAAGLGFKTFTTGEVLTAADTNGYLMQGVLVFASSAARSAAITSPQEGQYSYLKDTNSTEYYDGAAWIAAPIGDITGVTAGTGISGGGTSGTVTITNSMATEITAKGDLIVGTGSATFDNLPVGTNGMTIVADSSTATGLKWATASSGSMTLLSTTTLSGTSTTISSISQSYNRLVIYFRDVSQNTTGGYLQVRPNNTANTSYNTFKNGNATAWTNPSPYYGDIYVTGDTTPNSGYLQVATLTIDNYANTTSSKPFFGYGTSFAGGVQGSSFTTGTVDITAAVSSLVIKFSNGGTISGTVLVYGVS